VICGSERGETVSKVSWKGLVRPIQQPEQALQELQELQRLVRRPPSSEERPALTMTLPADLASDEAKDRLFFRDEVRGSGRGHGGPSR